jgi:hypothetical protein
VSHSRTKLERRARALLRAYPVEYRRDRAEEIIDTLLEAAPAGRSFPSARDTWSLLVGGRHARAARNRGLGARANLRLALLLGLAIFLSSTTSQFSYGAPWPTAAAVALITAAALAPWLGSRTATAVLVIPAGALLAYRILAPFPLSATHPPGAATMSAAMNSAILAQLALLLIALGALIALSGGPTRLPRSWSLLPCVFPAGVAMVGHSSVIAAFYQGRNMWFLLAAVVVCWLVIDARPAFGLCIAQLLTVPFGSMIQFTFPLALLFTHAKVQFGMLAMLQSSLLQILLQFAFIPPVMLPAIWLLRRQAKATISA